MRDFPKSDGEKAELIQLNVEPWMVRLLRLNPSYCYWGPQEDYMMEKAQWNSGQFYESWTAFGPWLLDDLNEVVNFYFELAERQVNLVLWMLHPRKGCSRGIEVQNIQEHELPDIFAYLRYAAERNAERFEKIPERAD